jgi:hypothetical protein
MSTKKTNNSTRTQGGEKRLKYRQATNEAFAKGDFVGAMNNLKAYDRSVRNQDWFMKQSEADKKAFVESKGGKWKKGK